MLETEGGALCQRRVNLLHDQHRRPRADIGHTCDGHQIRFANTVALAVEAHLVGVRIAALGVLGKGQVERRRQVPLAALVHEKGCVLGVIIPVAAEHIENQPAELFLHR